jgi:hypothetical protein
MRQFLTLLQQAFVLLGRHLVLVLPPLCFLLVAGWLWGNVPPDLPVGEYRWWLMMGFTVLLMIAFLSGWYKMMHTVALHWTLHWRGLPIPQEPEDTSAEPAMVMRNGKDLDTDKQAQDRPGFYPRGTTLFPLIGEFFGGIGEFYLQVALALLIVFGLQAGLTGLLGQSIQPPANLDAAFNAYQHSLSTTHPEQAFSAWLKSQPEAGRQALYSFVGAWFGLLMAGVGLFLLTFLWPAFLIVWRVSAFQALWRSLRQWIRDPLGMFLLAAMWVLYVFSAMTLFQSSPELDFLAQLGHFMLLSFNLLLQFLYVIQVAGSPEIEKAQSASAGLAGGSGGRTLGFF